jgi:hypothetical protein
MMNDWQIWAVSLIVGAALFYVLRYMVREWRGRDDGGCGSCACGSKRSAIPMSSHGHQTHRIELTSVSAKSSSGQEKSKFVRR